jgi:hypothetical protein
MTSSYVCCPSTRRSSHAISESFLTEEEEKRRKCHYLQRRNVLLRLSAGGIYKPLASTELPGQIRESAAMFCLGGIWALREEECPSCFKLQTVQELGIARNLGLAKCGPNRTSRSMCMLVMNIVDGTSRGLVLREEREVATTRDRYVYSRRCL